MNLFIYLDFEEKKQRLEIERITLKFKFLLLEDSKELRTILEHRNNIKNAGNNIPLLRN